MPNNFIILGDNMDWNNFFTTFWALIVGTGAICTAFIAIDKLFKNINPFTKLRKSINDLVGEVKESNESMNALTEQVKTNTMDIYKLTLYTDELPINERLNAGEKYVNTGGNGSVKIKYQELQKIALRKTDEKS